MSPRRAELPFMTILSARPLVILVVSRLVSVSCGQGRVVSCLCRFSQRVVLPELSNF